MKLSLYYFTSYYIYYTNPHVYLKVSHHSSVTANISNPHVSLNAVTSPLCHSECYR